jgi:hypothetical protein
MAKSRNTFQKGQREMEKKRKAEQKRTDKQRKKLLPPKPYAPYGEPVDDESAPE